MRFFTIPIFTFCHAIMMLMSVEVNAMMQGHALQRNGHQFVGNIATANHSTSHGNQQGILSQPKNIVSPRKQASFPHLKLKLSTTANSRLAPAQRRGQLQKVKAWNGIGNDGHAFFSSDDDEDYKDDNVFEDDDQINKTLKEHLVEKLTERFIEKHAIGDQHGPYQYGNVVLSEEDLLSMDKRNIELVADWLVLLQVRDEKGTFFKAGLTLVNILHEVDQIALCATFLCIVEDLLERQALRVRLNGDQVTMVYLPNLLLKHFEYDRLKANVSRVLLNDPQTIGTLTEGFIPVYFTAADQLLHELKIRRQNVFDVELRILTARSLIARAREVKKKCGNNFWLFPPQWHQKKLDELPKETRAECYGQKLETEEEDPMIGE